MQNYRLATASLVRNSCGNQREFTALLVLTWCSWWRGCNSNLLFLALVFFDGRQTTLLLSTTLLLLRLPFPGLLLQIRLHIFGGRENAGSKTYHTLELLTVEAFCTVWFSLSTITGAYPRSVKCPSEQSSTEQFCWAWMTHGQRWVTWVPIGCSGTFYWSLRDTCLRVSAVRLLAVKKWNEMARTSGTSDELPGTSASTYLILDKD